MLATQQTPSGGQGNDLPGVAPTTMRRATAAASGDALSGTLLGQGVQAAQAAACLPNTYTDFIETAKPEVKRLWPLDCRQLSDSSPAFSWPQPADRNKGVPWTFALKDSSGAVIVRRTTSSPRTVLAQTLPNGSYTWFVSYQRASGSVVSESRRFSVLASPSAGPLPTGSDFSTRVLAKAHPRIVPAGSSLAKISSTVKAGELKGALAGLLREADRALAAPLVSAPDVAAKSLTATAAETAAYMAAVRASADAERKYIEALSYAARLNGDKKYLDAAVTRIANLALWSPAGVTSEANQPQANRSIHYALALGIDLLWDSLSDAQKLSVANALKLRLADVLTSIKKLDDTPYASFENTAVGYALESLLLSAGMAGFPESKLWLEQVWEAYLSILNPYGGEDGSASSSVAYVWWDLVDVARTTATVKLVADLDMSRRAFIRNFGDTLIAFTAPNIDQMSPFGDGAETTWMYRSYAFDVFRMYATISRKPEHEWYWRVNPANVNPTTYIDPRNYMLTGLATARVTPIAPTKQSWVFPDNGTLAVHNKPADTLRSSLFFRSGREGAYNHSHADQNSFVFQSKGKDLLINSGYYDYYMSPHHAAVTRSTRYKNAVTFDGGIGQAGSDARTYKVSNPPSSMMPSGRLINQVDTTAIAAATGDATLAYRAINPVTGVWQPLLSNAVRSFAYFKAEGVIVIYDWLTSATARRFEFNYHAPAAFTTAADGAIVANNTGVSACIRHYGAPGAFSQTKAWDVAPTASSLPAQNHGRFTLDSASTQTVLVTVIREDCRAVPVTVDFAGTAATVKLLGMSLSFDQRQISLP